MSIAIASVAACATMNACSLVASLDDIRVGAGDIDAGDDAGDAIGNDAGSDANVAEDADAATTTAIFSYTGADQFFSVPAGVTRVLVKAWGGAGGCVGTPGVSRGGHGGYVETSLTVPPLATLKIVVGGGGTQQAGENRRAYLGGGSGSNHPSYPWSGGGGGLSGVLILTDGGAVPYSVVAGGGGGCGYSTASGNGGDGCAFSDGRGGAATDQDGGTTAGGRGGTLAGGGAGGTYPGGTSGLAGGPARGADGLFDLPSAMTSGGGGAGLYGGGSGAWRSGEASGAGGGGSCKVPSGNPVVFAIGSATTTNPDFDPSTAIGDTTGNGRHGRVVLRWTAP